MRGLLVPLVMVPLVLAGSQAFGQSAQTPSPPADSKIQTTSDANKDGLTGAVSAPLRDVNIIRTKIPPVLINAMADPYAKPAKNSCATLSSLIAPLDVALGDDLDARPPEDNEDLMDRGRRAAGSAALGAVASAAQDMIPMRGWVRKLSGAERHDRLVQSAITSGNVRRAYLKGLGEVRGCPPPATPLHKPPTVAPVIDPGMPPMPEGRRPRFPIRN
ncbi:hypothetical protein [Caulobacter henricii]|uniref:Uncharacterized protein n=1 Tax=Caulobacter henricii TaxID=69395 RepID=A0A0P0NZG1_9CAUL|nr:hypothetical protein [Caulobacter henricii]ALL13268.1 hypothetical protein AQ619_07825 [Caulobacter henricii]